jgi:RNA polymerase sigma-70 factor (ECF subfamily)
MTTIDPRTRASLLEAAADPANREARAAFAACYAGLVRDWCRRRGLQEADRDDVAQTVLCRLLESLPTFRYDPTRRFRGLVHRAVYRAIVDLHRARGRRPGDRGSGDTGLLDRLREVPDPDDPAVEGLARELAGQVERDRGLHAACERVRRRVEPRTWRAFWLTTVEGEPVAAAAGRLGMTKGAVAVARHRVTQMLRAEAAGPAGCGRGGAQPPGSP